MAGQGLSSSVATTDAGAVTRLVDKIGYLQRDPLSVVAPSHLLVLWSRLGPFDSSLVEQALWRDRSLVEYWAHAAAIVSARNYPVHLWAMRDYARADTVRARRLRSWLEANRPLRHQILSRLRHGGPLPARAFEGEVRVRGRTTWDVERDVESMLFHLWIVGKIAIAGRDYRGRLWELTERWLQPTSSQPLPSAPRLAEELTERSLGALGVATEVQIGKYMGAGLDGKLSAVLGRLERRGVLVETTIKGPAGHLPGRWWARRADVEALLPKAAQLPSSTTLLSPFDNLIIARARTEALFGFQFRMEIYVPAHRRRYGYYVLPILHRDQLIGRVDLRRDRQGARLVAVAVHAEPGAPQGAGVGTGIKEALQRLAEFVGASEVEVGRLDSVPPELGRSLRS